MNRKLAASLMQCLQDISLELQDFISREDFKFGYFEESLFKDEIVYFNKGNLRAGMKQIEKSFDLYKSVDSIFNPIQPFFYKRIPKSINENIDYASNYKLKRFTLNDFGITKRRNEFQVLCEQLELIRKFVKRLAPKLKRKLKKSLVPLKDFSLRNLSLPFIALSQNIKEIIDHTSFESEFEILDCIYIKSNSESEKDAKDFSNRFENHFILTSKKILQFQGFLKKKSIKNLFIYYILNDVLNIPESLDSNSLDKIRQKYQTELFILPVIHVKLNSRGETDYTNYFDVINGDSRIDYGDDEIILHKRKWGEFYDCLHPVEYNDTLRRLPLAGKYNAILSHPYFPFTDSNLYSILKHLHVKLHFLADWPEMVFSKFPSNRKLEYVELSNIELLKAMMAEYEKVLNTKRLKISLSSSFKLPKKISDIFLKGVILILEEHIEKYTLEEENALKSERGESLSYPLMIYWNKKKMKISPQEALKELIEKDILNRPFFSTTNFNLFLDSFISMESAKKPINPFYLNLESNEDCPIEVVKRLLYDLRAFYNKKNNYKEPIERFIQPLILACPDRFGNASLKMGNLKKQGSNMHHEHGFHKLKLITSLES